MKTAVSAIQPSIAIATPTSPRVDGSPEPQPLHDLAANTDSFSRTTTSASLKPNRPSSFTTADLMRPRPSAIDYSRPHISHRPTVIELDAKALTKNIKMIRDIIGDDKILTAVVKANGYGHGAVEISKIALQAGADRLAVAAVDEAVELRRAGITAPILVLGYNGPEEADDVVNYGITATVCDFEAAQALSDAAIRNLKKVKVHIKVNTGMNRLGVAPEAAADFITAVNKLHLVNVEGMFTHFSCIGSDQDITDKQLSRFNLALSDVEAKGVRPPVVHAANSAATTTMPEAHFDMVRCGGLIYGMEPDFGEPVLSWKTRIAHVNKVAKSEGVGYDAVYRTDEPRKIAAIPVGYGDGLPQGPDHTWRGVLVNGQFAPIRGKVCMDQAMIDVTDIPNVKPGDEVVLIGKQGEREITLHDVESWTGKSSATIFTGFTRRNRRAAVGAEALATNVIAPQFGVRTRPANNFLRSRSFTDLSRRVA